MEMFDTVHFHCPKCSYPLEVQTKAGGCTLARYQLDNVPEEIAIDLRDNKLKTCSSCGAQFEFGPRILLGAEPKIY